MSNIARKTAYIVNIDSVKWRHSNLWSH